MAFTAVLWRIPGKGGWTFADVPPEEAPPVAGPWGRTPVTATVDGRTWDTSVWRDRRRGTLLPIPARIRGHKSEGDRVEIELRWRRAG